MTFKELVRRVGQDEEFILKKLKTIFGIDIDLKNEIVFDFEEEDDDVIDDNEIQNELSFEDMYTEEELNIIFPNDEDKNLFSPEKFKCIFKPVKSENLKRIDSLEDVEKDDSWYNQCVERNFQIICLHWYAVRLVRSKYENKKEILEEIIAILKKYANNTFANASECSRRFSYFFENHKTDLFLNTQEYFEKLKYSNEIFDYPDSSIISPDFNTYVKKIKHKFDAAGKTAWDLDLLYKIEGIVKRSLDLVEKRFREKETATNNEISVLFENYCDEEVFPCFYKKTGKEAQLSQNEIDLIMYICEIIPNGPVQQEKLSKHLQWERISSEERKQLCNKINLLKENVQIWNRYILAETIPELEYRTNEIIKRILYPYNQRIEILMENISRFLKTKDVEIIPDEQYLKYYKLLKKFKAEMVIAKKHIMKKNRKLNQKFKIKRELTYSEKLDQILMETNYFKNL